MTILRLNDAGMPPPPITVDYGMLGLNTNTPYSLIGGHANSKIVTMLGAGLAGQVLAGVAGNNPVFKDVDTISANQLIYDATISSGSSNITSPLLTGFDEYIIILRNVQGSSAAALYLRYSIDGSNFLGGTNYSYSVFDAAGPVGNGVSQAQINLCFGGNMRSTAGDNNTFIVRLFNIDKAVTNKGCLFYSKYMGSSPAYNYIDGDGNLSGQTAAITNIRFLLSAGTFSAANIAIWGLLTT